MTFASMGAEESALRAARSPAEAAPGLKRRITDFVACGSTEITTLDAPLIPELAATLPPGTTVYVAHLPKATFQDVVSLATQVRAAGLCACPHLVARRLPAAFELQRGLARLADVGIDQALLVAGDRDISEGPFANTLDVIGSDVLPRAGLRRLAVAGHPEGHPRATEEELWQALRSKQAFGRQAGIDIHIVTQFGFDPPALMRWSDDLAAHGVDLPVHAGLAGPTSMTRLIRFAMQCGVGASLQAAMKNFKNVSSVASNTTTPEGMVSALVAQGAGTPMSRIAKPHLFAFGGALATARWIRAVTDGDFETNPEGGFRLTR